METLESQIDREYKFVVGAIIREKNKEEGRVRVLERYKTREDLVRDYGFWIRYSFGRTDFEKIDIPILPFEIVNGNQCRAMIDFLVEFNLSNEALVH